MFRHVGLVGAAREAPLLMLEPNWENRTVFIADNLDIMRGMDSATVDLIYADPPFNSGRTPRARER